MATALKRYNGGRVLVFVVNAFAEMSEDVSRICNIIAHDLARIHVSYYNGDAKRTKGMYRQRIQKASGHTAHRGWARLLLDRARDLIIHGPAHRGGNGAAMPTDEDDQDGHFFLNHPERGGLHRCLGARSHCYCCLDPTPPLRGGGCPPSSKKHCPEMGSPILHTPLLSAIHQRSYRSEPFNALLVVVILVYYRPLLGDEAS